MKKLLFLIPIILWGDKLKDCQPQQVKNYQDHVRSEVRGMKEGETTEVCPPAKKAPSKKKKQ